MIVKDAMYQKKCVLYIMKNDSNVGRCKYRNFAGMVRYMGKESTEETMHTFTLIGF